MAAFALAVTASHTSSAHELPGSDASCACACEDAAPAAMERGPDIDPALFTAVLAPHGEWIEMPRYGRVWVPNRAVVGADFRPYATHGHWVHAQGAWTWVSTFEWGWAPFHYGRWVYTSEAGYVWLPGARWAPAWVAWRFGSQGYVGWAPLPPEVDEITVANIEQHVPRTSWILVPAGRIVEPVLQRYIVAPARYETVLVQTTLVRQTVVIGGAPVIVGPARRVLEVYAPPAAFTVKAVQVQRTLPPPAIVVQAKARPVPAAALGLKLGPISLGVTVRAPAPAPAKVVVVKPAAPAVVVVEKKPAPAVVAPVVIEKKPAPAVAVDLKLGAPKLAVDVKVAAPKASAAVVVAAPKPHAAAAVVVAAPKPAHVAAPAAKLSVEVKAAPAPAKPSPAPAVRHSIREKIAAGMKARTAKPAPAAKAKAVAKPAPAAKAAPAKPAPAAKATDARPAPTAKAKAARPAPAAKPSQAG